MKEKIGTISFIVVIFLIMILGFFLPKKEVSFLERRTLQELPKWQMLKKDPVNFFKKIDSYLLDHFPFRDDFRKLKGITLDKVYLKHENHGVLEEEGMLFNIEPTLNEKSIAHLTNKINKVINDYELSENLYFAMVPDKNYYLDKINIPKLDYDHLQVLLKEQLNKNINIFDLTTSLNLNSYYQTDIHWRQEKLEPVVQKIREEMNLDFYPFPSKKEMYSPFYGALYGRVSTRLKADTINYLSNESISNAIVYNYEKKEYQKVYQPEYLQHIDSYDIFLAGATPLLFIENKLQSNGKELILFRDSFSSSLVPLLIDNYSKITLIDLRYVSSDLLKEIKEINFINADILFLYSIPIINNSFTIK